MLDSKRFLVLAPICGLRKPHIFCRPRSEWKVLFLEPAGANDSEPVSQAIRIHSGGRADRLEIRIVVKEKLLRLAAETQRPANPFLQRPGNHGAPKPFLRRSPIVKKQKRTFEHALGPLFNFDFG